MKKVSVIIPCRNEERHIEACLMSLLNNGYPKTNLELIVVDGESSDKTIQIVSELQKEYPQIVVESNKKRKTPFALNLGIEKASGDYTLIASAHSSFEKGYIQELSSKIKELNTDVVGGSMRTEVKNKTSTSLAIKKVLAHPVGVGNALFRTGVDEDTLVDTVPFGLYKTSLLQDVGGYDVRLIRNHDIELSKRLKKAGVSIYLIPTAKCVYFARESWGRLAKNNFDNGKWNLLTVYLTNDFTSLSLRHFIPLIFLLSIFLPAIGMLLSPYFGLLSLASLFTYLLALMVFISRLDRKGTTFLHLLITFIVLHFSYGAGSLIGSVQVHKIFKK